KQMSFCEIKKEEKFKKLKTSPNEEIGHSSRAVCCCISHECNTFFFINLDGERQQGGEISLGTQKQHAIAETVNQQQQISEMLQEHSLTSSSVLTRLQSWYAISDSTDSTDSTDSSDKSKTCHKSANQDTPGNFSHQPSSSNTNDSNNESLDYTYDCSMCQPFFTFSVQQHFHLCHTGLWVIFIKIASATHTPPFSIFAFFAAVCHILDQCSVTTTLYILKSQVDFLKIVLSHGLLPEPQQPRKLLGTEQEAIKTIPHDIHTIIDWLQINP
ncbi:hypothetical protein MJO29_008550, partial [Puccinia striiformis f. sp. tritici]